MEKPDVEEIVRLLGRVLDLEEDLKAQIERLDHRVERMEKKLRLNDNYDDA